MQIAKVSIASRLFYKIDKELDDIFTFIISIAIAYVLSMLINLRSDNPYNISNITNVTGGWNPENNYIKVVFIIIATVAIFFVFRWIKYRFSRKYFRILIALFASLSILLGTLIPQATNYSLDPFGHGEQLAPSLDYHKGEKLFTDIFTLHGPGEDILIPNLSFAIFNHNRPSISSYILLTAILKTVTAFMFFLLIARLIQSPGFYLLTVLYFLTTTYAGFSYMKNIPFYVVIALFWLLINKFKRTRIRLITIGSIGLIGSVSVLDSYDVGTVMTLTVILASIASLFLRKDRERFYRLQWPQWNIGSFKSILAATLGVIAGQLLILIFLGAKGYADFIQTFYEITRYQGLMFDYPVIGLDARSLLFWLPIILLSIASYLLVVLLKNQYKQSKMFDKDTIFAITLMLSCAFYLRFGVGRPDMAHIAMASPILILTGLYIIQLYFFRKSKTLHWQFWPIILFIALLGWPQLSFNPTAIFLGGNTQIENVKKFIRLPSTPDSTWLTLEQKTVTEYIDKNSSSQDTLFVVVPEPLYYYTTDRKNPTRFAISWFMDPIQYTNEALNDLKNKPPKFIIYDDLGSPNRMSDGVPIAERFPKINDWIIENYTHKTVIDQVTLLSR